MTNRAIPIVALDVSSAAEAFELVRTLGDSCGFYKVGNELFTAEGPSIVRSLRDLGVDVFLDLKFHDIPNTVASGVRRAAALGARLVTVHAAGGQPMLEAAQGAAGPGCGVLAVTVLTSLDGKSLGAAWGRGTVDVMEEVLRLSGLAAVAGVHGIVCSGAEAGAVRAKFGGSLAPLIPGIRLAGDETHDQRRVLTPGSAQTAGARYLVLGRAVTASREPREAMGRVLADLAEAASIVA